MKKDNTITLTDNYIMHTYKRIPIVMVKGKGVFLWDNRGKKYIDFLGARGAANTGYSNPDIIKAVTSQTKKLILVTNDFYTTPQAELARLLVKHSFAEQVFFCNSGAEANEGAIKLSRLYSYKKYGAGRYVIISATNSFHGRTYGALSATGQKKYQTGFEPLVPGFRQVKFNDIEEMDAAIGDDVCAVILEPIQGEGGIYPANNDYMKFIREKTKKKDILLIIDEVQVGLGRTGKLFAYEHFNIKPNIVTIAKSIAGGLPMGVILATKEVAKIFDYGTHGTTFGGSPLAAQAGIAALNYIIKHKLPQNARRLGNITLKYLFKIKNDFGDLIKDVRGMGLAIGVEFKDADITTKIFQKSLEMGLITNVTNGNIIRFLPPLIISEHELKIGLEIFSNAIVKVASETI